MTREELLNELRALQEGDEYSFKPVGAIVAKNVQTDFVGKRSGTSYFSHTAPSGEEYTYSLETLMKEVYPKEDQSFFAKIQKENRVPGILLDNHLEDDSSAYGGVAYAGETLRDFIEQDPTLTFFSSVGDINEALEECGIKPITGKEMLEAGARKKRLYVDMDGTLAVFQSVDTLERLYEPGYFSNLPPLMQTVEAVRTIVKTQPEIEVHILSAVLSDSKYALQEKNQWLDKYLPEIPPERRIFTPCGEEKTKYIKDLSEIDYLLDDYTKNLQAWQPPGTGIKLLNGINHSKGTWKGELVPIWEKDMYGVESGDVANNILKAMDCYEPLKRCKDKKTDKKKGAR
ncbi:5'(3')-deoxyribonucleotidase [Lachnospiraceae bacterium PM6-15]|uniref:5' nucleotidase, NT5C type n=1 Tax=Ohessyouella blattaphilus TaxID=2949333 RepID=UPI003E2B87B9